MSELRQSQYPPDWNDNVTDLILNGEDGDYTVRPGDPAQRERLLHLREELIKWGYMKPLPIEPPAPEQSAEPKDDTNAAP